MPDAAGSGAAAGEGIGPGVVVLLVGPSGVGKDALLSGAHASLRDDARFIFVTREITRPPHPSEVFAPVSEAEFEAKLARGDYAMWWRAHGLGYGVPRAIDDAIRAGRVVVFNASRAVVAAARARYANARVVLVDCPVAIRAQRMAVRGRESEEAIAERLARTVDSFDSKAADAVVDNAGTLPEGVKQLTEVLVSYAAPQGPANG